MAKRGVYRHWEIWLSIVINLCVVFLAIFLESVYLGYHYQFLGIPARFYAIIISTQIGNQIYLQTMIYLVRREHSDILRLRTPE